VAEYVSGVQQRYTQSGGVRPFGISTLIMGFDRDGTPQLFQTEPSGNYTAWKVLAMLARTTSHHTPHKCPSVRWLGSHARASRLHPEAALAEPPSPSVGQAVAIGRNQKTVKEYLEKNYSVETAEDGVKLACRALLEVVEAGGKNIEVAVLRPGKELQLLTDDEVDVIVKGIEEEKEAEEKAKKKPEA
jgi:20S proteasome subunit alpha 4